MVRGVFKSCGKPSISTSGLTDNTDDYCRGCGTRTIRLTRTKKHQKQDNSMDVEKGEFVDRDVFQVQAR